MCVAQPTNTRVRSRLDASGIYFIHRFGRWFRDESNESIGRELDDDVAVVVVFKRFHVCENFAPCAAENLAPDLAAICVRFMWNTRNERSKVLGEARRRANLRITHMHIGASLTDRSRHTGDKSRALGRRSLAATGSQSVCVRICAIASSVGAAATGVEAGSPSWTGPDVCVMLCG